VQMCPLPQLLNAGHAATPTCCNTDKRHPMSVT
jgi:hypothetical protein